MSGAPVAAAGGASLAAMVKDAAVLAGVSLALAFPLVGFETADRGSGMVLETRFAALAYAVLVVFAGRLGLSLAKGGWHREVLAVSGALSLVWLANAAVDGVSISWPTLGWLTWMVASVVALRAGAAAWRQSQSASDVAANVVRGAQLGRLARRWLGPAALGFALVMPFMPFADQRLVDIGILVMTYVMLGWGLNVVVGLAGLLDLGYVAFYAVGAYSYALLSITFGLNFWEALPIAGVMAALFGIVLGFPVLRLRGDYLAIVTLGFGEMIRLVLLNWEDLTGGPKGIGSIPRPSFFGLQFSANPPPGTVSFAEYFGLDFSPIHRVIYLYYIILFLALLTNWFTMRIRRLPIGRAWEALREDEIACRALGINPTNTKLTAFGIGAMLGGFAGAFFATRQGFISPESFNFIESAIILAIVVLGGMGSQVGVVIASVLLIGGPEMVRDLEAYRMLAFGGLMVAMMLWKPEGLVAIREPTLRAPVRGSP